MDDETAATSPLRCDRQSAARSSHSGVRRSRRHRGGARPATRTTIAAALILSAVLVVAASAPGAVHPNVAPSARVAASEPAAAETAFALHLLGAIGGSGNVVYSPYSIDTALSMAAAGALGQTATQIDHLLGASSTPAATADAGQLRRAIGAAASPGTNGAPTLELANALWTQQGIALQSPFVATLTNAFGAPPRTTDFRGAPETAREAINAWVSAHTANLIQNLLPQGSVSAATVFVLANAIYLKAHWKTPFSKRLTHNAPFTTSTGAHLSVPFMSADDATFSYGSAPGYQAVELPYSSSSLSLLAILPAGGSLTRFDATLNATTLAALVDSLHTRRVNLRMPKVDLHTQTALNGPLEALGMRDAFGAGADFGGITAKVPLQISLVEHAADLKVDEQGTVAAAATGIVGPTDIALPPGPVVTLNLDHPYLLLLRDDASGAILFAARVADPSAG